MTRRFAGFGLFLLWGLGACRPDRASVTAGQIGCPPGEIKISAADQNSGLEQSVETWFAKCRGHTFVCTELDSHGNLLSNNAATYGSSVSCHEQLATESSTPSKPAAPAAPAPAPPAVVLKTEAPSGAAGFTLGGNAAAARQGCEAAGNTWQASAEARALCSGPASPLGFTANVTIKFCEDKACAITIHHRPESDWASEVAEVKGKLVAKYGLPNESDTPIPAECRSDGQLADCVMNHELRLRFAWAWSTGERVILAVGKPRAGGDPSIRIDYTKPVRKIAANASAL